MGHLSIMTMTNENPEFYKIMGPYLSRKEIAKELGGPVWDSPDKLWFIAINEEVVIGFAAIMVKANEARFCSAWVKPEHRNHGIYSTLLRARVAYADERHLLATAVARLKIVHVLERYGFVPQGKSKLKNYIYLIREVR